MEENVLEKNQSPWVFAFVLLFCVELFIQIGLYGIRPIVSGYTVSLGGTYALAGFLAGLMSLVSLVARPLCGAVIDRFNRFNLLVATTLVLIVFSAICGMAQSILGIAICESARGVAFTFKSALITAMCTLIIPHERLGWGIGVINLGFTVSGAIGPLLSSFLLVYFDYPSCFFFASGISCVAFLLLLIMKARTSFFNQPKADGRAGTQAGEQADTQTSTQPDSVQFDTYADETQTAMQGSSAQAAMQPFLDDASITDNPENAPAEEAYTSSRKNVRAASALIRILRKMFYLPVLPYSFIGGLLAFSYGSMLGLLYLVQDEGYVTNASLYFVVFTAFVVVARIVGGRLSDTKGVKIVIPMIVISLVGSIPIIFSGSTPCLLMFAVTMGVGQGPVFGILQADAMKHAPEEELGKVSNTSFIIMDLFMGISPFIGGVVLEVFGCQGLFLTISVLFAVALGFTWRTLKRNGTLR